MTPRSNSRLRQIVLISMNINYFTLMIVVSHIKYLFGVKLPVSLI